MVIFDKLKKIWQSKWLFGIIFAFIAAVLALFMSRLSQFENFELKTYDARFKLRGPLPTKQDNIVIVAIDDQTFLDLKMKWPFPRNLYAKAILNLLEAGARLIIFDIEFTEPDANEMRDVVLAGAIKRAGNVILAGKIVTEIKGKGVVNVYPLRPLPILLDAGAQWGLIDVLEDTDGFIRRYLLFRRHGGQTYLSLSLLTYLNLLPQSKRRFRTGTNGQFVIGDLHIPKKEYNSMLINYRGPAGSFPTYSFSSVVDDAELDIGEEDTDIFELHKLEGTFRDKIVFIGAAAEELQDNKLTPFFEYKGTKRKTPGVEMHANALSTLIRRDFIRTQSSLTNFIFILVLAYLTMFFTKWLKPFRGMFSVVVLVLAFIIWAFYSFLHRLVWVEITGPMLAIVLSYVGSVVHQVLTEQREKFRIKKTWQHYMAKNVIDEMLETGQEPTFGGERRELTVLFSDIRSFTTFSEKHSSHEVVHKLNEYLTAMVDIIFKYEGTLDKFVGDEIMAIFGAPIPQKDHALRACMTALEMVARLRALQREWVQKNEDLFQIGIGINTGKMIVGNLGSSQLFDYTVIGDEVNLGARLEGTNKQYGTTVIISEATYRKVRHRVVVRELDLVRVKGKNRPVRIFELLGIDSLPPIEKDLLVEVYHKGLQLYKARKFYQALKEFRRILKYFPTDGPTRVYIKRCLDFIEFPPPEDWDGVYEMQTK
ncbi:MAG: adenylate/guanylate cyclase domain-containing protein [Calditrichaeota bacterium]|nr:MAG: adenylate/guanylate cyclase domain-containing protein [Calditrichota bacterium]